MNIERFFARPLALWPGFAPIMFDMLRQPSAFVEAEPMARDYRPYDVVDGIAVIRIAGVLVHDATWSWCETEYSTIWRQIAQALADDTVKAIALHIDSPGGEVAGCFDLAEKILAARGGKPIWSILDEMAYSAAYAIACVTDHICVPRTGGTGSIGVIAMHVDMTKALEHWGVKVTTFQFGDRKSDSYPTTPLSEEAQKRFQADVDVMGEMFVDLVARGRGLSAAKIRNMEAATFLGQAGIAQGLADDVLAPDDAFLKLRAAIDA